MNYPVHFKVQAKSQGGIQHNWTSTATEAEIKTAIPPEFSGPGGGASPEDLYALSLGNCFLATFKVIAEKSKLNYELISVEVDLAVDYDEQKKLIMKSATLSAHLSRAENQDRALRLLQKTPDHCMILNSVKTIIDYRFTVD